MSVDVCLVNWSRESIFHKQDHAHSENVTRQNQEYVGLRCSDLSVALCGVLCLFTFADDMMNVERDPDAHAVECMAVRMALATAAPHSSQSVSSVSIQTECVAPVPVTQHVALSSSCAAPVSVIEYVTPTLIFDAAPVPVAGPVAPAPADSYATPTTVNAYLASHTWRLHL